MNHNLDPLRWLLLIHILTLNAIDAAEPYNLKTIKPQLNSHQVTHYRELEGKGLQCLTEDDQGRLWFGLQGSVWRYDGYRWKEFQGRSSQPLGRVRDIIVRRDGTVVAAGRNGVFILNGNEFLRTFPPKEQNSFPVFKLSETSDGVLWAGGPWGLVRIANETPSHLFTAEPFAEAAKKTVGVEHVTTIPEQHLRHEGWPAGTGVVVIHGVIAAMSADSPAREAGIQLGDRLVSVTDSQQRVVEGMRSEPGQALRVTIDRENEAQKEYQFVTRTVAGAYPHPALHGVEKNELGETWITAASHRILRTDADGRSWQSWSGEDDFHLGRHPSMLLSDTGTLWVVSRTRAGGVNRFDGSKWTHDRLSSHGSNDLNFAIVQSADGLIWVSGDGFLNSFDGKKWTVRSTTGLGFPGTRMQLEAASDGSLWYGSVDGDAGRIELSPEKYLEVVGVTYQCSDALGHDWFLARDGQRVIRHGEDDCVAYGVSDGMIDSPSRIIAGNAGQMIAIGAHEDVGAVAVFDLSTWSRQTFPNVSNRLSAAATVDQNGYLIASGGLPSGDQRGGVLQYKNDKWLHHAPPKAPKYSAGIAALDNGSTLFVGRSGATIFDGQTFSRPEWGRWADADFSCIAKGTDGVLWIGSRTNGLFQYQHGRLRRIHRQSGLQSDQIVDVALADQSDIWVCYPAGLCRGDGNLFETVEVPVPSRRTGSTRVDSRGRLWINGRLRIAIDREPPNTLLDTNAVELDSKSKFVVSWQGSDPWNHTSPEDLSYACRLDDGEWSPYSQSRTYTLENLPPGQHELFVRARDNDLNVESSPAVMAVTILPPIWMRAWFLMLVIAVACVIAWQTISVAQRGIAVRKMNLELTAARDELNEKCSQLETANADLESYAHSVAHDLRAPLRAMYGFARALREDQADQLDDDGREYTEYIETAAQRMDQLINDLLAYSQIESKDARMVPVDLKIVVDRALNQLEVEIQESQATVEIAGDLLTSARVICFIEDRVPLCGSVL